MVTINRFIAVLCLLSILSVTVLHGSAGFFVRDLEKAIHDSDTNKVDRLLDSYMFRSLDPQAKEAILKTVRTKAQGVYVQRLYTESGSGNTSHWSYLDAPRVQDFRRETYYTAPVTRVTSYSTYTPVIAGAACACSPNSSRSCREIPVVSTCTVSPALVVKEEKKVRMQPLDNDELKFLVGAAFVGAVLLAVVYFSANHTSKHTLMMGPLRGSSGAALSILKRIDSELKKVAA